jgi:hypothetical protein
MLLLDIIIIVAKINDCKFIVSADDLKIYREVKTVKEFKSVYHNNFVTQVLFGENCMELNVLKTQRCTIYT